MKIFVYFAGRALFTRGCLWTVCRGVLLTVARCAPRRRSDGGGPLQPLPVSDGGRDFGRPGSILRKKRADRPGVQYAHRRSGEPSSTVEPRRGPREAARKSQANVE